MRGYRFIMYNADSIDRLCTEKRVDIERVLPPFHERYVGYTRVYIVFVAVQGQDNMPTKEEIEACEICEHISVAPDDESASE